MSEPVIVNVRVEFRGELATRFETVKSMIGLQNNTDLMRLLVNEKYNQLNPKKTD